MPLPTTQVHDLNSRECGFCGDTVETEHYPDATTELHDFCRTGLCFVRYRAFVESDFTDLTIGIPFHYRCMPKSAWARMHTSKKRIKKLHCAYCGATENVIVNICMKKRYSHGGFCKNNKCCAAYMDYIDNVPRIPYALCLTACR